MVKEYCDTQCELYEMVHFGVTAHRDQEANTDTVMFDVLSIKKCCSVTFSLPRHHENTHKNVSYSKEPKKQMRIMKPATFFHSVSKNRTPIYCKCSSTTYHSHLQGTITVFLQPKILPEPPHLHHPHGGVE